MTTVVSNNRSTLRILAELDEAHRRVQETKNIVSTARYFMQHHFSLVKDNPFVWEYPPFSGNEEESKFVAEAQHHSWCRYVSGRLALFYAFKGYAHAFDDFAALVRKSVTEARLIKDAQEQAHVTHQIHWTIVAVNRLNLEMEEVRRSVRNPHCPEDSKCELLRQTYKKWGGADSRGFRPTLDTFALIPLRSAEPVLDTWKVSVLNDVLVEAAQRLRWNHVRETIYQSASQEFNDREVFDFVKKRQSEWQQCNEEKQQIALVRTAIRRLKVAITKPSDNDQILIVVTMNNILAAKVAVQAHARAVKSRISQLNNTAHLEQPAQLFVWRSLAALLRQKAYVDEKNKS